MKVSVIISTNGSPALLQKSLWGFEYQTFNNFELVVAEEAESDETKALIKEFSQRSGVHVRHLFDATGKCKEIAMINKAVSSTNADYLIFSNDHCIPRNDLVEVHMKRARKQHFLSGGYFGIPVKVAKAITKEDIATLFAFNWRWLYYNGLQPTKLIGLTNQRLLDILFDRFSSQPPWCAFNSSAWREDVLSINGFNEDLTLSDFDWDFGERLSKRGVNGIQVRHDAICLCVEGKKPAEGETEESRKSDKNRAKLQTGAWAVNGISKSGTADVRARSSAL
ncbi:MAG TPA: glycosyltransferase [Cyclobacteriaceae bacterium]|nr:glycosyltransferase [Cyclobacteriaceae bacterium]